MGDEQTCGDKIEGDILETWLKSIHLKTRISTRGTGGALRLMLQNTYGSFMTGFDEMTLASKHRMTGKFQEKAKKHNFNNFYEQQNPPFS